MDLRSMAIRTLLALVILRTIGFYADSFALVDSYAWADSNQDRSSLPIQVVASLEPLAYFADRIGGDDVHTEVLVPSGACLESYEPQFKQLRISSRADVFIKVGHPAYSFETNWLDVLLASSPTVAVLSLNDSTQSTTQDPHIWLSIEVAKRLVTQLSEKFSEIRPRNKEIYNERAKIVQRELQDLESELTELLKDDRGRAFLVFHPAWGNFANQFGLKQLSVEQEGKEPSAGSLMTVIRESRELGIKMLFLQPGTVEENANIVAEEIGGRTEILDPLQRDWFTNMRKSAKSIKAGLGR